MHPPSAERYTVLCDLAEGPLLTEISLPAGACLRDAISLLQEQLAERVDWSQAQYGIWGQRRAPETLLSAGDRIEVYRPLSSDPRDARRANAKRSRLRSAAAGRRAG